MTEPELRADLDSPWKDILRAYFPQAITFFFPQTSALIDWDKSYEFLDKEFQKVSQDAAVEQRKVWKVRLTKALYEKGFGRQAVLDLYRFIDWAMILPEAVEREFWQELQAFEEEQRVTYVTNAERFGIEKGIKQGIAQGAELEARSLILRQLTRRVGVLSPQKRAQVESLALKQLESLGEALLDFSSLTDLDEWLRPQVQK